MGKDTKIEWCDHTWNPWIGCTKVSPGCARCYAEALNIRWKKGANWGKGAPRNRTSAAYWKQPRIWNRDIEDERTKRQLVSDAMAGGVVPVAMPRPRVFSASLADWLDDEVSAEWLADFLDLVRVCDNLDFLLLTKRPRNWRSRLEAVMFLSQTDESRPREFWDWVDGWLQGRAPGNVWVGTTAEDQERADERVAFLLCIPARVRFLSCEPLLSAVDLRFGEAQRNGPLVNASCLHWVIVGGESGTGARAMSSAWARDLRDQCAAEGVAFFFKQWGEWAPTGQETLAGPIMAKVGKKNAGKELDGEILQQFPA